MFYFWYSFFGQIFIQLYICLCSFCFFLLRDFEEQKYMFDIFDLNSFFFGCFGLVFEFRYFVRFLIRLLIVIEFFSVSM